MIHGTIKNTGGQEALIAGAIVEVGFLVAAQKWQQETQSICGCRGIDLESNYARMAGERQNRPVAKVVIKGNDGSTVLDGPLHDFGIIGRCHANFRDSDDVIPLFPQGSDHQPIKHLIDEKRP
jgi:hypothetical protein